MRIEVSSWVGQALIVTVCFLLGACNRTQDEIPLIPPSTLPLSRSSIGYAVTTASYTLVLNDPATGSVSLGYLRRGSVTEVLERRQAGNRGAGESWVLINGAYRGWIREEDIQIYDNEAQAKTASESLIQ
jgi:hypothetical protein